MKSSPSVGWRTSLLILALSAWAAAGRAAGPEPPRRLLDLMAQGKTETDLGHFDAAVRALGAVADAPDATPALRAEALVRLGVARRGAHDFEGALQAFQRAVNGS